jgi:hypothetical protein
MRNCKNRKYSWDSGASGKYRWCSRFHKIGISLCEIKEWAPAQKGGLPQQTHHLLNPLWKGMVYISTVRCRSSCPEKQDRITIFYVIESTARTWTISKQTGYSFLTYRTQVQKAASQVFHRSQKANLRICKHSDAVFNAAVLKERPFTHAPSIEHFTSLSRNFNIASQPEESIFIFVLHMISWIYTSRSFRKLIHRFSAKRKENHCNCQTSNSTTECRKV